MYCAALAAPGAVCGQMVTQELSIPTPEADLSMLIRTIPNWITSG